MSFFSDIARRALASFKKTPQDARNLLLAKQRAAEALLRALLKKVAAPTNPSEASAVASMVNTNTREDQKCARTRIREFHKTVRLVFWVAGMAFAAYCAYRARVEVAENSRTIIVLQVCAWTAVLALIFSSLFSSSPATITVTASRIAAALCGLLAKGIDATLHSDVSLNACGDDVTLLKPKTQSRQVLSPFDGRLFGFT